MKTPKLPCPEALRLSVIHWSLPIEVIAVMHSRMTDRQRKEMIYATVADAARVLMVPLTTLRARITRGHLPSIRVDGKLCVSMPDARAIVASPPKRGRPAKPKPVA